jgi:hypothetical protein
LHIPAVEAAAADAPFEALHIPAVEAAVADAPFEALHIPAVEAATADAPFEAQHASPMDAALADVFVEWALHSAALMWALHSAADIFGHEALAGHVPVAATAAVALADLHAAALAAEHFEASAVTIAAEAPACLDLSQATASAALPAIMTASAVKTSRACFIFAPPGIGRRPGEHAKRERGAAMDSSSAAAVKILSPECGWSVTEVQKQGVKRPSEPRPAGGGPP